MTNLYDLPTEVIDLIFDHLQFTDLELVGACCERFLILAEPHRAKRCLSDIRVGCGHEEDRSLARLTPLFVLCSALIDPRFRRYAKRLTFRKCSSQHCLESHPEYSSNSHMSTSYVSSLQLSILKDIYGEIETTDELCQKLCAGNHDVAFAVLLLLLKNVREVELHDWPGIFTRRLVEDSSHLLSHISKVTTTGGFDGSILTNFARQPSMRVLEWTMRLHMSHYFMRSLPSFTSNAHSIRIYKGIIPPGSFSSFLSHFRTLHKFIYTPATDYDIIWSPSAIVAALIEHASASLETLDIKCERSHYIIPGALFIGSLQLFKRLRYVRVDFEMFLLDGIAQKLIDMLPASVEILQLRHENQSSYQWPDITGSGIIAYLFSDLPELKEERLPNLWKIISSKPIKRFFKIPIEEAGIVVEAPYCSEK